MKSYCRLEREDNKRRKLQAKRRPYRANLIRAGGEPHSPGGSTRENEVAEAENPSKEGTHAGENKKRPSAGEGEGDGERPGHRKC